MYGILHQDMKLYFIFSSFCFRSGMQKQLFEAFFPLSFATKMNKATFQLTTLLLSFQSSLIILILFFGVFFYELMFV